MSEAAVEQPGAANGLDMAGRIAFVTGAGQGVGQRIVHDLARLGAGGVAVNDIDADRAERVAKEIREIGVPAIAAPADVGDFDGVGAAFAMVERELGPVGILVNNAGNQGGGGTAPPAVPFWEQLPEQWDRSVRVNLGGVLNCGRHAVEQMVRVGKGGRIITVISDAGRMGEGNGLEAYSGAKAGAAGLTRALARIGGRYLITANSVALGATYTPATADMLADERVHRKVLEHYMIRRIGDPADGSAMICFLASEAAGWVTGQTVGVNGGFSVTL
ncbi:SDR family NAD(P)-dependent oxidoreductase [[Mycobacterium] burgundiense]|jgi:3-oxoacyl-[acyl-carrier protein] reductase|uniref:SDR family oxidoreductase n=1 Tax=[Mycobacterium] burgundiense TaxID=3064286 RepID=A0ABM9LUH2_9MYCO|nr:SDR family oxidoreductase [Mycolicibacterium sp. MU0053]CAJ1504943.1 SDR family oxidoreductase [Mycolicibacterium sp. MU0053]